jgi:hypothetical protein
VDFQPPAQDDCVIRPQSTLFTSTNFKPSALEDH